MSYKDNFAPKAYHVIDLCIEADSFGGADQSTEAVRETMGPCDTHNCVDRDCSQETRDAAIRGALLLLPPLE